MKMVQLRKQKRDANIKAEEYINRWIKLLKAIKPSGGVSLKDL